MTERSVRPALLRNEIAEFFHQEMRARIRLRELLEAALPRDDAAINRIEIRRLRAEMMELANVLTLSNDRAIQSPAALIRLYELMGSVLAGFEAVLEHPFAPGYEILSDFFAWHGYERDLWIVRMRSHLERRIEDLQLRVSECPTTPPPPR